LLRYVLGDNQGSTEAFVDGSTGAVTNASFTALGLRRNASTWSGDPANRADLDAITRQGYTYQTVLGSMGLNHMNGRVQDAAMGRFISADPTIPQPGNTQSYNRYAYVLNNPATSTDPTGFYSCGSWSSEPLWIPGPFPDGHGGTISGVMTSQRTFTAQPCPWDIDRMERGPMDGPRGTEAAIAKAVAKIGVPNFNDSPCDQYDDYLKATKEEQEKIAELEKQLHALHLTNEAIEGLLEKIAELPPGANIVGVGTPQTWIWLGQGGIKKYGIMFADMSQGSGAVVSAAHGALRWAPVAGAVMDGLMIGYEVSEGHWDKAAYKSFDSMASMAMIRYGKTYGALAAVLYNAMGGSESIARNLPGAAFMSMCAASMGGSPM
jgi:RHS repeat-associated protein